MSKILDIGVTWGGHKNIKDLQSLLDISISIWGCEEAEADKIENLDQRQKSRPLHSGSESNVVVTNIQMMINGMELPNGPLRMSSGFLENVSRFNSNMGRPYRILFSHTSSIINWMIKPRTDLEKTSQFVLSRKISHILERIHHPQTNGKIERVYEIFQSRKI